MAAEVMDRSRRECKRFWARDDEIELREAPVKKGIGIGSER